MNDTNCCNCFKPKATLICGACNESLCKYCAQFLKPEDFAYVIKRPALLQKDTFCGPCFNAQVEPALDAYRESLKIGKADGLAGKPLFCQKTMSELGLQLKFAGLRVGARAFKSLISNIICDDKPSLFAEGGGR